MKRKKYGFLLGAIPVFIILWYLGIIYMSATSHSVETEATAIGTLIFPTCCVIIYLQVVMIGRIGELDPLDPMNQQPEANGEEEETEDSDS